MGTKYTNTEEVFWKRTKINRNGCFVWQGSKVSKGYGSFCYKGRSTRAHRLAYKFSKGTIPKGKMVCHSCDVRLCVNPKHLWLGTAKDNAQDAKIKGRNNRGEKNGKTRLTDNQVLEIRRIGTQEKFESLGKKYGVSARVVSTAFHGRTWKHLLREGE